MATKKLTQAAVDQFVSLSDTDKKSITRILSIDLINDLLKSELALVQTFTDSTPQVDRTNALGRILSLRSELSELTS